MTELPQLWRRKSDYELLAASERLDEYSEASQQAITAEIERRKSPEYLRSLEPPPQPPRSSEPAPRLEPPPIHVNSPSWIAQRALLAVGLMVGFYMLAVTIAAGLLWIPYAELTYMNRVDLRIGVVCVGSAVTILWSLLPRRDQFTPPGPPLYESTSPQLFSVIRRVAEQTKQDLPDEVYLLNDVNAFVTHRGGTMGFGSHRVMGIGLPLLQTVTVAELEAIIAHEFGHYSSGDVALGPWIYKTRAAIVRTIGSIRANVIRAPFVWYARQFLKLTHAVSRRQELIADQLAARVAGVAAAASALRRVSVATPLYAAYLNQELMPALNAGVMPPISAGFHEFLTTDHIDAASRRILAASQSAEQTNPFDTHPSLAERLTALGVSGSQDDVPIGGGSGSAASLIGDPERYARTLLELAVGHERFSKLKPIDWSAVGPTVYPRQWRLLVTHYAQYLSRYTADSLPLGRDAFIRAGSDLVRDGELDVTIDQRVGRAVQLFAVAVGVVLLDDGWRVNRRPGRPIVLERGSDTFEPFAAIQALAAEGVIADAWKGKCVCLGISGRPLAGAAAQAALRQPGATPLTQRVPAAPEPTSVQEVNCWRCKHVLIVTPETRGRTVKCAQCGAKQQLPR
jgi:Zn-dependent protease with chaperone function